MLHAALPEPGGHPGGRGQEMPEGRQRCQPLPRAGSKRFEDDQDGRLPEAVATHLGKRPAPEGRVQRRRPVSYPGRQGRRLGVQERRRPMYGCKCQGDAILDELADFSKDERFRNGRERVQHHADNGESGLGGRLSCNFKRRDNPR
jgi:hypothetical protein